LTLGSIEAAQIAARAANVTASFTVFDDGSTDGTSTALANLQTEVRQLRGDGSAFWAQSMARAEQDVLENQSCADEDFLVWLNDDVRLDETALVRLKQVLEDHPNSVVIGATRDRTSLRTTYSGMKRSGMHPLRFDLVEPSSRSQNVETFNGNLVLVPVGIARLIGGIDGGFSHALADIDYGLRCGRLGIELLLAPGTHGVCDRNPMEPKQNVRMDWQRFIGSKGGGNFQSLRRILRKGHPMTWPLFILSSYGMWWLRRTMAIVRSSSSVSKDERT
jgi:GT2 family glycosyltransferase